MSRDEFFGQCRGLYHILSDSIFLKSQSLFHYSMFISSIPYSEADRKNFDYYKDSVRHELAHWDIGSTVPHREMRELSMAASPDTKSRFSPADKYQEGYFRTDQEVGSLLAYSQKIFSEDNVNPQRQAGAKLSQNLAMQENLFMSILNEAAAYAIMQNPPPINKFPINSSKAVFESLFSFCRDNIEKNGRKETMSLVKSAIDESWKQNKPVTDVLGISIE